MNVGVDLGGTKLAVGTAESLQVITTPATSQGIIAAINELAGEAQGIGICVAGRVDLQSGSTFAAQLPQLHGVPLVAPLSRPGRRVTLLNDADAAALAEHQFGAARGTHTSLYVTVSTGIGAGIVLNGRLWRGRHGVAGELGHITVMPGGPVSGAGLDGALEAVASGTAIARDASYALNREVTTAEAFNLAQQGHPGARRVIAQAMKHIGVALADLQKVIDPEVFVIGGGVASVGDYFFHGVQAAADEYAKGFAPVTIRRAQLGPDAGVIGAALAARYG